MSPVTVRRFVVVCVAGSLSLGSVALAGGPASRRFLEYRAALEKAASAKEILSYLPKSRREMLGFATEGELVSWFKTFKGKRGQTDVKVVSEKPSEKGVVLSAEGTAGGNVLLGRIEMLAEDGSFAVGEEIWYPRFAPVKDAAAAKGDFAKGHFTVNGREAKVLHAYARLAEYSFNPELPEVRLTISDAPIDPGAYDRQERASKGELHYFELTIGPELNVTTGMMYHDGYEDGDYVSMAGMHELEPREWGPTSVSGRVYLKAPNEGIGGTTMYDVEFKASLLAP